MQCTCDLACVMFAIEMPIHACSSIIRYRNYSCMHACTYTLTLTKLYSLCSLKYTFSWPPPVTTCRPLYTSLRTFHQKRGESLLYTCMPEWLHAVRNNIHDWEHDQAQRERVSRLYTVDHGGYDQIWCLIIYHFFSIQFAHRHQAILHLMILHPPVLVLVWLLEC